MICRERDFDWYCRAWFVDACDNWWVCETSERFMISGRRHISWVSAEPVASQPDCPRPACVETLRAPVAVALDVSCLRDGEETVCLYSGVLLWIEEQESPDESGFDHIPYIRCWIPHH
jgi:hypothetical protein